MYDLFIFGLTLTDSIFYHIKMFFTVTKGNGASDLKVKQCIS